MALAYPSVLTNSALNRTWKGLNDTTCMKIDNLPTGGWIFSDGHHILRGSLQILMVQVIILNTLYLGVYYVLKRLKQTKFVCSVLAGVLLGAITRTIGGDKNPSIKKQMNYFFPLEAEILTNTLGFLGITFFIFLTAVKMDITMIRRTAKKAAIIGIFTLLFPLVCILLLVYLKQSFILGKRPEVFKFLFSSGLAVTRFINTAYAFDEMDLLTSKLGQLVMSSTMMDEIFTWAILIAGATMRRKCHTNAKVIGLGDGPNTILSIVGLLGVTIFILRPILVLIVKKTPQGKPVKKIFTMGVLVLAMVMTFLTDSIGAPHMGALVLGLAVPDGPPLGSDLVRAAEFFVMNYLMPLFYIIVGYSVDLSTLIDYRAYDDLSMFITAVALGAVTKFISGVLSALASKLSRKDAVLVGLMMNLKGPIDLFLFKRWITRAEIKDDEYTILVMSHVILTAIVTPLINKLYKNKMSGNGQINTMRELQTNPTIGEVRILCCVHHEQDISIFLPFLKASNPTFNSPTSAYVAHLSSLDGRAVPVISHDDDRKTRRLTSNQNDRIASEFEKYTADSNGLVTTKMYTMIAPYRIMHHNIVTLAQEENIALIVSPFHKNYAASDVNEIGCVCTFNKNLLRVSPCTVGILVDKGMSQFTATFDNNNFSCNVGILFIGGTDDREAATFATRMLGNPSVNMTMVRLQVSNYYSGNRNSAEEKIQLKLDEKVMCDFRVKSERYHNVGYHEINVDTIEEAFDGIRTLGSDQDLILVGRHRHVVKSIFDDVILEWSEYRELGAIGDFVASDDFQDGKTSVLVMQRYNMNENHHSIHVPEPNFSP